MFMFLPRIVSVLPSNTVSISANPPDRPARTSSGRAGLLCRHVLGHERHFLDASKVVLVQNNLNTHKPASLYAAFPATEARRLVERFEWLDTQARQLN